MDQAQVYLPGIKATWRAGANLWRHVAFFWGVLPTPQYAAREKEAEIHRNTSDCASGATSTSTTHGQLS